MTRKRRSLSVLTLVCTAVILCSCSETTSYRKSPGRVGHGPPAHAPAHGHRRKHAPDVQLVFDSGLGVYVVIDLPNHYYLDGCYYRFNGTHWQTSVDLKSGWSTVPPHSIPPGLRAKKVTGGPHPEKTAPPAHTKKVAKGRPPKSKW